jgi:hypothetical protein
MRAFALVLVTVGCVQTADVGSTQGVVGTPRIIARVVPGIQAMELDENYLYLAAEGDFEGTGAAALYRIPRGGGTAEQLASLPARVYALAMDDDYVYLPETISPADVTSGSIHRVAKTGGALETLVSGINNPTSIVVDDASVYFTIALSPNGEIWRVAKTGGIPSRVAVDIDNPWDLAVDADALYVSEMNKGSILRLDKSTGAERVLASGWIGTGWLRASASEGAVYFGACATGECPTLDLYRVAESGGAPEHIASVLNSGKLAVASTFEVSGQWFVPRDGSSPIDLLQAERRFTPYAVAADERQVFIADVLTGSILAFDRSDAGMPL